MNCQNVPSWVHYLVIFIALIWEAWLGKTDRVRPNSTIALVAMLVVCTVRKFWNKKEESQQITKE